MKKQFQTLTRLLIVMLSCSAVVALLFKASTRTVMANTFFVNNLDDHGSGSLRQAIANANAHPGADIVDMRFLTGTIHLESDLDITDDLTINGAGPDKLEIQAVDDGFIRLLRVFVDKSASISGIKFSKGNASGSGGAISAGGNLTVTNCEFHSNRSTGSGGAIYFNGIGTTLTVTNCSFTSNDARSEDSTDSSMAGGAVYSFGSFTTTNIQDSTFDNNTTAGDAGHISADAIGPLTVKNCTFSSGTSRGVAGAIASHSTASTIEGCTFSFNSGNVAGGAISNAGSMTIKNSTFSNNSTIGRNPPGFTGLNGLGGAISNGGTISIIQSTFAGNGASRIGGAIYSEGLNAAVSITQCTIANNSCSGGDEVINVPPPTLRHYDGFGGGIGGSSTINLQNSIIANNTVTGADGKDVKGTITSLGHNLIGDTAGSSGWQASDIQNQSAKFVTDAGGKPLLADNGGPTRTIALKGDSPALDAGDNSVVPGTVPNTDQRGNPRIKKALSASPFSTIDIGAFEVQPLKLTLDPFFANRNGGFQGAHIGSVQDETMPSSFTLKVQLLDAATVNNVFICCLSRLTDGTLSANINIPCSAVTATFTITVSTSNGAEDQGLFTVSLPDVPPVQFSQPTPDYTVRTGDYAAPGAVIHDYTASCATALAWQNFVAGRPTDPCFTLTASENGVALPGNFATVEYGLGTHRIDAVLHHPATLATATVSFNITVVDGRAPKINCAGNITATTAGCSAQVTYFTPGATDDCGTASPTTCSPPSGTFPVGVTTVTCTSTDAAGNVGSCHFTVTVTESQPPSISQTDITRGTDPNLCAAVVSFTPTVSDNCSGVGTPSCAPASGSTFPKGITTVNCQVTDASGNTASCSFKVTVNDGQAPSINCASVAAQSAFSGANCSATVPDVRALVRAQSSDNCTAGASLTVTQNPAQGTTVNGTGSHPIQVTVIDEAGNIASCTVAFAVIDNTAPTIACPANISRGNDANKCTAVITFAPTASDNCSGVGSPTCAPPSGTVFTLGTTTVTCTVRDAANNQSAPCSFTVTVNDTQAPSIVCPGNRSVVTSQAGGPSAVVNYPAPTVADNCAVGTPVCTPPSGSTFAVGVTTVTCAVADASGNTATCNFNVSVFNACLQDDSNPGTVLLFNTLTGDYSFCCGGSVYTGKGTVTRLGNTWSLTHNADRRVSATLDGSFNRGTASLQIPVGTTRCTITDRDIRNNACQCQ